MELISVSKADQTSGVFEQRIGFLFATALGEKVGVVLAERAVSVDADQLSHFIGLRGESISLGFSSQFIRASEIQNKLLLALEELGYFLVNGEGDQHSPGSGRITTSADRYLIRSIGPRSRCVGELMVIADPGALNLLGRLGARYLSPQDSRETLAVPVPLSVELPLSRSARENEYRINREQVAILKLRGRAVAYARAKLAQGVGRLTIVGEMMSTKEYPAGVTLNLGSLNMSLGTVLGLRPGTVLEFQRPAKFSGAIQIAGEPYLSAEIQIEGDKVLVAVRELLVEQH